MLNNINVLKEELDFLISDNAPYEQIYSVSCEIDKLLVEYYMKDYNDLILGK